MVGIGGACSPIEEWTQLSEYSSEDLALLRQLRDDGAPCAATTELPTEVTTVGGASGVVPTIGILALMLSTAFL